MLMMFELNCMVYCHLMVVRQLSIMSHKYSVLRIFSKLRQSLYILAGFLEMFVVF